MSDIEEDRQVPYKPKGVKEPQDRKPKKKTAAEREAGSSETTEFEYFGVDFEVPAHADDLPAEVNEYFELSRISNGLRELFGNTKWAEYRKLKPTVRDDKALFNILADIYGFSSLGE